VHASDLLSKSGILDEFEEGYFGLQSVWLTM
jgi:hypothetical protein